MTEDHSRAGERILAQLQRLKKSHPAKDSPDSPRQQYLSFQLNEHWYALNVSELVEVLPLGKITRVPSVPDYIVGVMNLRGEILSVTDLKRFLGLPAAAEAAEQAIIVVEHAGVRTGLLVDQIGDLVSLAPEEFTEEPLLAGKANRVFFAGAVRWGEVLLSIIDLPGLFGSERLYGSQG